MNATTQTKPLVSPITGHVSRDALYSLLTSNGIPMRPVGSDRVVQPGEVYAYSVSGYADALHVADGNGVNARVIADRVAGLLRDAGLDVTRGGVSVCIKGAR